MLCLILAFVTQMYNPKDSRAGPTAQLRKHVWSICSSYGSWATASTTSVNHLGKIYEEISTSVKLKNKIAQGKKQRVISECIQRHTKISSSSNILKRVLILPCQKLYLNKRIATVNESNVKLAYEQT